MKIESRHRLLEYNPHNEFRPNFLFPDYRQQAPNPKTTCASPPQAVLRSRRWANFGGAPGYAFETVEMLPSAQSARILSAKTQPDKLTDWRLVHRSRAEQGVKLCAVTSLSFTHSLTPSLARAIERAKCIEQDARASAEQSRAAYFIQNPSRELLVFSGSLHTHTATTLAAHPLLTCEFHVPNVGSY